MILVVFSQLLFAALAVEALTELVVKSEIFKPLRKLLSKLPGFNKLLKCGYCFSFWVAAPIVLMEGFSLSLTGNLWLDLLLSLLLLQRTSNIIHNCIDKFTDKYYHGMYINSDKEED